MSGPEALAPPEPGTHIDGEVIPHVLPDGPASDELDGPASLARLVPVQEQPGGIQDREKPEPCEQEAYEDGNADLGWERSRERERELQGRQSQRQLSSSLTVPPCRQLCPVRLTPRGEN